VRGVRARPDGTRPVGWSPALSVGMFYAENVAEVPWKMEKIIAGFNMPVVECGNGCSYSPVLALSRRYIRQKFLPAKEFQYTFRYRGLQYFQ